MRKDLETYWTNTQQPWGKLFYQIIWAQLPEFTNSNVLDFGSGFGFSASHFAHENRVTAIEPNAEMVTMKKNETTYQQLIGGEEILENLPSHSFDLVLCHNVLEYADERKFILEQLCRVTKSGGLLSIVKHNKTGRIMQKTVFENNISQAIDLLDGGGLNVANFGRVNYYSTDEVQNWMNNCKMTLEKFLGCRTFFALQQNNEDKFASDWQQKMFAIEMKVASLDVFRRIAFFNHLIFRKQ
ncbi:MAG: class I SAM-dependent methyltransferase [Sporolactobacillus sp.]